MTNIEFFGFFTAACVSLGIAYYRENDPKNKLIAASFSMIMWVLSMYQWVNDHGSLLSGAFYAFIGCISFDLFMIMEAATELYDEAMSGGYKVNPFE